MNTFILMWNPAISSVKMEEFCNYIEDPSQDMNWSVWDHKELSHGDRFFLVKVGEGRTGIVASGTFWGEPWQDEDWSSKGREVYYANMEAEVLIHPDSEHLIATEQLQALIPDFDWTGGHSGRLLTEEQATRLEVFWMEHLLSVAPTIKADEWGDRYTPEVYISDDAYEASDILQDYFRQTRGNTCEVCGYNYQRLFGPGCNLHHDYKLTRPLTEGCTLADFHCLCGNCSEAKSSGIKVLKEP